MLVEAVIDRELEQHKVGVGRHKLLNARRHIFCGRRRQSRVYKRVGGIGKGRVDPMEHALDESTIPSVNATVAKLHSCLHTDLDICIFGALHPHPRSYTAAQGHDFRRLSCLRERVLLLGIAGIAFLIISTAQRQPVVSLCRNRSSFRPSPALLTLFCREDLESSSG